MKFTKILFLILGFFVLSSCTVNPEADLRIKSVEPTLLTSPEAGDTITVTLEVTNGVDVEIQGYQVNYYYDSGNKRKLIEDITHQAELTEIAEGGFHSGTGSITVMVAYQDLIDYVEDNDLKTIIAEILIYARDEYGNDLDEEVGYVTLYF